MNLEILNKQPFHSNTLFFIIPFNNCVHLIKIRIITLFLYH